MANGPKCYFYPQMDIIYVAIHSTYDVILIKS